MSRVSVVVVSYNVRAHLERCLTAFGDRPHELIVVDSHSTDGSTELVRSRFPSARLIVLERNEGYGAAANRGIEAASGDYFLVVNADAWPTNDAVARLAAFADGDERIGIVGPKLLHLDGSLQPSLRGFPTPWRLATEYLFLRWLAPWSSVLNSFYGGNFDYRTIREAEFLMGAALLLRRSAIEEVGGFDPAFFMFSEEVDLCFRMRMAGWRIVFYPDSEFVHVGGASTRLDWDRMYREQIRGHLLFFAKHYGRRRAKQVRSLLVLAFRLRGLIFRGERGRLTRKTARWLASGDTVALLEQSPERASSP